MKKILFALAFIPTICFSQKSEKDLATIVCHKLSNIDLTQPKNVVDQESVNVMGETYMTYQADILKLMETYRVIYSDLSDTEIATLISKEITVNLMMECESYQSITMFNRQPAPKISETTRLVGEYFNDLLIKKTKDTPITSVIVDVSIFEATENYKEEITTHFGSMESEQFISEFNAYLMTKSIPYVRWTSGMISPRL